MVYDNHSKYEKLYEKSVKVALINKSRQIGKSKICDNKPKNDDKTICNNQKRKLSEYNKFISENSSKVTGPDRLKKLSKLWKQYKINNNDVNVNKLKSRQTSKSQVISNEKKRSKTVQARKPVISKDSVQTKSPKRVKKVKEQKSPKKRRSKSSKNVKISQNKSSKDAKSTQKKSPKPIKNSSIKNKKSEKDTNITEKDINKKSPVKHKKLRFFNYIGSPKSNGINPL